MMERIAEASPRFRARIAGVLYLLTMVTGVLMAFGGLGWLAFLSSPLASHLSPTFLPPASSGEGSLTLWLLVIGVNEQRWKEQASGR
jgi:hypothetical protein